MYQTLWVFISRERLSAFIKLCFAFAAAGVTPRTRTWAKAVKHQNERPKALPRKGIPLELIFYVATHEKVIAVLRKCNFAITTERCVGWSRRLYLSHWPKP